MASRGILCWGVLRLDVPAPFLCDPRWQQRHFGLFAMGDGMSLGPSTSRGLRKASGSLDARVL